MVTTQVRLFVCFFSSCQLCVPTNNSFSLSVYISPSRTRSPASRKLLLFTSPRPMKALTPASEMALAIPRLVVAAAQPYQTMEGPALTTNFAFVPQLLPFQTLPFTNSMVAPLYYHTLLHSLAEFAETPRPARHSHVRQLHAPKEDFWRSVGTLNTFYHTHYPTVRRHAPSHGTPSPPSHSSSSSSMMMMSPLHPSMGAAELVRASHRKEYDVRLTLYDEAHQPISAMLMTGPSEHIHTTTSSGSEGTRPLARRPLPFEPVPSFSSPSTTDGEAVRDGYWTSASGVTDEATKSPYAAITGPLSAYGGLYGDVVSLSGGTSWAHRAAFQIPSEQTSAAATTETAEALPVPPWMLYQLVVDFTAKLYEQATGSPASGVAGTGLETLAAQLGDGSGVTWWLCAQQTVVAGDVVFGEPLEVVCAQPRVAHDYRLPPWRRAIGHPALSGGAPCVTMRAEIRQSGAVQLSGTFFVVPVVSLSESSP